MMRNSVCTVGCLGLLLSSCDGAKTEAPSKEPEATSTAPTTDKATSTRRAPASATQATKTDGRPRVVLETSMGTITIELDQAKAPITVANFLKYVDDGHYGRTIFHRVISNFMIQGGGFEPGMREKPTRAPIKNEAKNGLKNRRGTIAMARTNDPHSATAQFFINVKDNTPLDYPSRDGWGYCVFGKVVDGMDVVDKIKNVPTTVRGGHRDVPVQDVVITAARRK